LLVESLAGNLDYRKQSPFHPLKPSIWLCLTLVNKSVGFNHLSVSLVFLYLKHWFVLTIRVPFLLDQTLFRKDVPNTSTFTIITSTNALKTKKVSVVFLPSCDNPVDMFTKNLPLVAFLKFRDQLGLIFPRAC